MIYHPQGSSKARNARGQVLWRAETYFCAVICRFGYLTRRERLDEYDRPGALALLSRHRIVPDGL